MRIFHRIYGDWTLEGAKILFSLGIHVEPQRYGSFDIEEGKIFDVIKTYFNEWGINGTSYWTTYEDFEIDKARLLTYILDWNNGYPQPEDKKKYKKIT